NLLAGDLGVPVGGALSGSPGSLLSRGPLRTERASFPALGSSKPRGRCGYRSPALASQQAAVTGGVYQACAVPVRRAASPMVGEEVGGDRPFDDAQPPAFPVVRRLRRLIGREDAVPAEWAAS